MTLLNTAPVSSRANCCPRARSHPREPPTFEQNTDVTMQTVPWKNEENFR